MATRERPVVRSVLAVVSGVGLGAGGLFLGFVLALLAALVLVVSGVELTPGLTIVISLIFVQGIGCAGVALAYTRVRPSIAPTVGDALSLSAVSSRFRIEADVPDFLELVVVAGGYVTALATALVGGVLVSQLQVDTGTNQAVATAMEAPEVLLILIPASFVLIGPGEELLFRGVVQGRLREVFGPVPAIATASAIFAGLHWFALSGGSPTGNLAAVAVLLGPAFVLGAAYEFTDNIVVPSLIHGLYNATLFTLLYVSIAYSDELEQAASGFVAAPV